MLRFLDILLTIVHLFIVGFNLLGWIWPRTRKAHFVLVVITAFCWLVIGIWYGFGYCPLTDWQWQVKQKLGETNLPNSFITYYANKITGKQFNPSLIDTITGFSFATAAILSVYFNFIRKKKKPVT